MKFFKQKRGKLFWTCFAFMLILVIAGCSISIDSIVQASSANAGEILPVKLNVTITTNQAQTSKFIVGFLAPKGWSSGQNTTVTFTSDITTGDQTMSLIPAGTPEPKGSGLDWPTLSRNKLGIGGNLIDDVEWVVFASDAAYTVNGNVTVKVTVDLKTKVGNENMMVKLGYMVANSTDGLSGTDRYSTNFPGCFSVVNGTGDLMDFCNPQLAVVDPNKSLDNDIVSISFDGGVTPTALDGANEIYLCATGYTNDNKVIKVCSQQNSSQLFSQGVNRWRIDLWPRQYFHVTDNQTLTKIEYFFTDKTGNIKVGYGGTAAPFVYTFKCE